ncbi:MAG: CDP-diacylglycerol--glycerol-3-phosphate 3-phosphatidyltransferase [Pseudomonadota bacterium]|nr:CDP-diacylglycerol--glycerol-3-phosphate 3-phosphatidyltransferase [Pseudomonadota bacterium]
MNPMINSLANRLTVSRIVVIPLILVLLFLQQEWAEWIALVLFVAAGITDLLDGYVARRDGQVSMIGEFLDPIADKLLVAAVILLLVYNGHITGNAIIPAVIILMREVAVSGLREFLAGVRVSMPVSHLAKWKTFIQIWAISFLIGGDYAPSLHATLIGDICLWVAGVLTVVTAWDYWRASIKHFKN